MTSTIQSDLDKLEAESGKTIAEYKALRALNAELVAALELARECIAYCRRAHKDAQSGTGIPVEIFIDAVLAKAKEERS